MKILLTYDVTARHAEVKKALKDVGFEDYLIGSAGGTVCLPNTTLWMETSKPVKNIYELLRGICLDLGVTLIRGVAFEFKDWWGAYGEAHQD